MLKTINIDSELHKKIKLLAIEKDMSISELIEKGVKTYFNLTESRGGASIPTVTTGPISKGGPISTEKRGEVSLREEFHPVPKK